MASIGFLGAGNMAAAIVGGIVKAGLYAATDIVVSDVEAEKARAFAERFGVGACVSNQELVARSKTVVIAVKPQVCAAALAPLASHALGRAWISVVAGVTVHTLRELLGPVSVVRAMPNTPALIGQGSTGLAAGPAVTAEELAVARGLFEAVGRTVVVNEAQLDAVTGLSGSGPAYVMLIIEALADGGVRAGLPREVAQLLAAQTVAGAASLQLATGTHPAQLKDQVTSPGGTTAAGLHELERAGLRGALMDAVWAATQRATELGQRR